MNTANVPERVDVVVVGGGMAGLSAARDLLAANVSVLVLEARNRVGGRLLNHTLGNGSVVELGGQWVGPTQDRVLALAEELGLGLFPTYVEGEHFLSMDGSVKRYVGEDFALPESALADLEETWERLRKMADEIPLEGPWLAAKADTWDAQTVDSWLVTNTKTETGLGYWRTIVPALFRPKRRRCRYCTSCSTAGRGARWIGSWPPTAVPRKADWRAVRSSSLCGSPTGWATPCGLTLPSTRFARTTGAWR